MKVFMARHGDTVVNADEVVQSVDNILSPQGLVQAENVAAKLANCEIDLIVSSSLPRAINTAEIINQKLNKKLLISSNFAEVKWPSILEGVNVSDPRVVEYRQLKNDKNISDISWHYADEENFVDLKNRAVAALQELINLKVNNVLVVSHSTFMKVLVSVMCHGPEVSWKTYYDFLVFAKPNHTSVSVFDLDAQGKWHMDSWNL